ncbi:MAG: hypothetical protein AAGA87_10110 [Pseudomonadota bacterium]
MTTTGAHPFAAPWTLMFRVPLALAMHPTATFNICRANPTIAGAVE